MPRRSARVSKANSRPHWRLPLPWEEIDAEDERRQVYLKARDDLGYPPLRTAEDLTSAVMGWVTRPVLEAWYFDPDAAVRRFALWLEVEETRRAIFDQRAKRNSGRLAGLEGFGPDGRLTKRDPRFLRVQLRAMRGWPAELTDADQVRLDELRMEELDELAAHVAPFGFVVSAVGTVDIEARSASGNSTTRGGSA